MNLNKQVNAAELKTREFLNAMSMCSGNPINNENHTASTSLNALISRRSSIHNDICRELDLQKLESATSQNIKCSNRQNIAERPDKFSNRDNYLLNKAWVTSVNVKPLECQQELHFVRAFIWMKSIIKIMKEVSQNDIREVFNDLTKITYLNNPSLSSSSFTCKNNTVPSESSQIEVVLPSQELKQLNHKSAKQRKTLDNNQKNNYLTPNDDNVSLDMFKDSFCGKTTTNNNIMVNDLDSGIALKSLSKDSINSSSKFDSNCNSNGKSLEENVSEFKGFEKNEQMKYSNEFISSMSLSNLIENHSLHNFALGEIRIILSKLEKCETAEDYNKHGLIHDSIVTIVQFLNQLVAENDVCSSTVYLQLCIQYIMDMIIRIINSESHANLPGYARESHLLMIMEFCYFRQICEKTIDYLINYLTELCEINANRNLDEYENQPTIIRDDSYLFCHILQVVVKKYCEFVGSREKIDETFYYCTAYTWGKQSKNIEYQLPKIHSKDLELEWSDKIEKLFIQDPSSIGLSICVNSEALVNVYEMLSALS